MSLCQCKLKVAPHLNFEITSQKGTSVTVYTTPFGLLNVGSMLRNVPEEHNLAEVRGLELLDSIMMSAETWERVLRGWNGLAIGRRSWCE